MKNATLSSLLFCLAVIGCGDSGPDRVDVSPVSGTLYLDNQPKNGGTMTLSPVGNDPKTDVRPAVSGTVGSDGKFTLTTYDEGDGAAPGDYTLTLGGDAASGSTDPTAMMSAMSGPTIAPFTVTIPEGGSDSLEIKVASMKKRPKKNAALGEQ